MRPKYIPETETEVVDFPPSPCLYLKLQDKKDVLLGQLHVLPLPPQKKYILHLDSLVLSPSLWTMKHKYCPYKPQSVDYSTHLLLGILINYRQKSGNISAILRFILLQTRKLTRLRPRIGLHVKLFLLNLYMVGSLPCILKSNWIGLQVKLGRGERERERNEQLTGGK